MPSLNLRTTMRAIRLLPTDGKRMTPTAKQIDSIENKWGFRFPGSYRNFVESWGPGELSGYVNIHSPTRKTGCRSIEDLFRLIRSDQVRSTLATSYRNSEFISRMIPFSDTIGGDIIVWDPMCPTPNSDGELKIFALPDDQQKIIPLANSFPQFIKSVVSGSSFRKVVGAGWKPERTYAPFSQRKNRINIEG